MCLNSRGSRSEKTTQLVGQEEGSDTLSSYWSKPERRPSVQTAVFVILSARCVTHLYRLTAIYGRLAPNPTTNKHAVGLKSNGMYVAYGRLSLLITSINLVMVAIALSAIVSLLLDIATRARMVKATSARFGSMVYLLLFIDFHRDL